MKNWRKLAALILAGIMAFALVACAQEPEEEPKETEKPTETTEDAPEAEVTDPILTVDPETFKEYIGTWYADGSSASYRIIIKEDAVWQLTDASEEIISSGTLRVNEDEEVLEMYDPDGSLAITVALEDEGTLHVDIMLESLTDTLSTNTFLNKITNDVSDAPPTDIEDTSSGVGTNEEVVAPPPVEDEEIAG